MREQGLKRRAFAAFAVGFIFALGLGIAGMTQPQRVVAFLDLFGDWNPSLAFVMIGAIAVHSIAYRIAKNRTSPLFDVKWHIPTKKELTPSLMVGAFVFGVGWGLAGYCPGPALTSLASFDLRPWIFVVSMIMGMGLYRLVENRLPLRK
jgi:uncharacterized membrane protein YedE/YeeE